MKRTEKLNLDNNNKKVKICNNNNIRALQITKVILIWIKIVRISKAINKVII